MARVRCTILEVLLPDPKNPSKKVHGTKAECLRCDRVTTAFGQDEKSVKRCLAQMREGCELEEQNYYLADD